jgi:hypothetical protein
LKAFRSSGFSGIMGGSSGGGPLGEDDDDGEDGSGDATGGARSRLFDAVANASDSREKDRPVSILKTWIAFFLRRAAISVVTAVSS